MVTPPNETMADATPPDENRDPPPAASLPAGPPAADRHVTFLPDPILDHLLRAVVTLTMELSVTRDRLASLERVLDAQGLAVAAQIETLTVTAQEDDTRRAERERLIQAIIAPIVGGIVAPLAGKG